jgi:hypothetical protein
MVALAPGYAYRSQVATVAPPFKHRVTLAVTPSVQSIWKLPVDSVIGKDIPQELESIFRVHGLEKSVGLDR